jgi:hypothetical protein
VNMEFFSSDLGVAIAWIIGVSGSIFGIFQKSSNMKLRIKLQNSINSNNSSVNQNGEKNIYTEKNSGGMNIKM